MRGWMKAYYRTLGGKGKKGYGGASSHNGSKHFVSQYAAKNYKRRTHIRQRRFAKGLITNKKLVKCAIYF